MRRSQFFLPTLKENPKEAEIISHKLMLRSGMIYQQTSGIYSWLPLGVMVLKNIEKIIDEEQSKIGCQRIIMPTIQPAYLWKESGRYDNYGKEMLRIKDRHDREMLYGPTHEEVVTDIARKFLHSYKNLPCVLYQINWKFRDEVRPRFGVMRGREFLMKDGYSFDISKENALKTYRRIFDSYIKIFDRVLEGIVDPTYPDRNIKVIPAKADPGPIGGDYSHEFHIIATHGESKIYFDPKHFETKERNFETLTNLYAVTDDLYRESIPQEIRCFSGIEVGHIFYFGTKYAEPMGLSVIGPQGEKIKPEGGSYGIGLSRLVAAIIEASHDENGIIWPLSVAPFQIGLINLLKDEIYSQELYRTLYQLGIKVLFDDRKDVSAGIKFSEMELIGIPFQIILGNSFLETKRLELKNRRTKEIQKLSLSECENFVIQMQK